MAAITPSNRQPVTFPRGSEPPPGAREGLYDPAFAITVSGEEAEARTRQLSLLVEVNAALATALDVEPVLGTILARLADRARLSHARIYRLDEAAGELRPVAWGGKNGFASPVISLQEPTLLAWTIRQKKAAYVPRVEQDPRCQGFGAGERCAYAVPLQTRTSVLGVLDVSAGQPDGIRSETRKLIDQVATQVALALERSGLYRQLRGSEERFRSVFEQVHVGVAVAGPDGRFSTVNPAFARLLGYTGEELQGKSMLEVTHPQDAAAQEERVQSLREGAAAQAGLEVRFRRKSGEYLWCAINLSLLHDAAGRPACLLEMVQDIDERKKAEEERARLQRQFFQAQKMEVLGTLAGGVAHDFNNLLNVMMGFASLARQRLSADDPLQDSMSMIEQSAQRAADLTRQLLGFARPERQQIKPVCVDDVLEHVRRMVMRTFDRSISVVVRKEGAPLWVKAEPSYLEQALLNLCINARDAMPQGGTLTLERCATRCDAPPAGAEARSSSGENVTVSVQDTGAGIAPEALPRLFEPFFTTKEPGRGTGLGLAMVYGFVKNLGGFVKVESEPGHGACFALSLPLIAAPALPAGAGGPAQLQAGRGTVLVVDDEPMVRAFATQGLKGLGYRVLVAESGAQALQIYEQHAREIDCVLLDLIMPELSGLETFRRMRAADPQARVIFASGYSTGEILRGAPDARPAGFIGKPYTLEALSIALRKAGVGQPRHEENRVPEAELPGAAPKPGG